jgi:eukaryotic-like serine/threonine-protein kinase
MQKEQVLDGRYRLTEHLGVGGMSVVWKAHDELLNRSVAVKVLAGPQATDPAARQRIRAEARAAAQLWHPNVTNVYDYGESTTESDECVPYVVMELLPGRTLSQRLAAGPLPSRSALRICAEVASALAAAHARGLVHRDVKPSNVMLTPTGAKVVDFGLAAVAGQPETDEDGEIRGTPAYLAPERLAGGEVIPASDVYALGLLIYRVLTNHLPWQAETTTQMLSAHAYVEPAPLPPVEGIPPRVTDVCHRCLAKDPADRPSAGEVAAALADAAGIVPIPHDDGPATPIAPAPGSGRHPPEPFAATSGSVDAAGDPGHTKRRRAVPIVTVGAVIATIAAGVLLDQHNARRAGGTAAIPPAATPGATSSTGTASAAPATPIGAGPTAQPSNPVTPTPRTKKPSARPSTSPPRASSSPPALPGRPVSAYGGVARVWCIDRKAEILSLDLAAGYTVKDYQPGPADQVKAVLVSAANKSEIIVKCDKGAPAASIKETPQ